MAVTSRPARTRHQGPRETIAFLAMAMALSALAIDVMLPAFRLMRPDFGLPDGSTGLTTTVTAYLWGLAAGTVVSGPLSDHFGRRVVMFVGFGVYALGATLAATSPSLTWLVASRFLWGLGASGPRVVTMAVVRDTFEGERMARAMSLVMAVFILVPIFAPTIGALVVSVSSWRWLFVLCVAVAVGMAWWGRRLRETLAPEHRLDLSFRRIALAGRFVVANRQTRGYTLAIAVLFGAFTSYLASAENIFGTVFGEYERFPLLFSALAVGIGASMLLNARIVGRLGVRRVAHTMLFVYLAVAATFVVVAWSTGGRPPLWAFMLLAGLLFCSQSLLIPNFNTVAMQPMAAVAGTASAVIGATQTAGGASLGALLDRTFDGSVLPLSLGFLISASLALALVVWAERGRLFQPLPRGAAPAGEASAA